MVLPARTIAQGNPPASDHQVDQTELADWMEYIERLGLGEIGYFRNDLADLPAASSVTDETFAIVLTDATEANRGVYQEQSDAWVKTADLPPSYQAAADILDARTVAEAAAAAALVSEGNSSDSEDAAALSELAAINARGASETARDQAIAAASLAGTTIYDDTTAGLAATSDTEYFLAYEGPGLARYLNNAGSPVFQQWYTRAFFDELAAMDAFPTALPEGMVTQCWKEGFTHVVAAPGATDHHVLTTGGNKFYLADLSIMDVRAFFPPTDGSDPSPQIQKALDVLISRVEAGIPCCLNIIGEYTAQTPLLVDCTNNIFAQCGIDMTGGEISSGIPSGTLFKIKASATVRNFNLTNFRLLGAGTDVDVLLEIDGGDGANQEAFFNFEISRPELSGGKVPLWIRNNVFEGKVDNCRISPASSGTDSEEGRYAILFDDNFDASSPFGVDGGSISNGNVSSITFLGGTVRGGQYAVYERSPADARFFGTTFLESWNECYRGPSIGTQNGGIFGCHFENPWFLNDWTASTAYSVGDMVQNDSNGNCYECVTAGTSAGSGGPTGTGSGIADGTAVWDYISVRPTVWMNNKMTVRNSDFRQNGGYSNYLISAFLVGRNRAPDWIITNAGDVSDLKFLYLRNNSDNGTRLDVGDEYRGKIGYSSATNGPRLVSIPRSANHTTFGTTSGTLALDMALGSTFFVQASGNITFSAPTNAVPGDRLTIHHLQDGVGGHGITFPGTFVTTGLGTIDTTASTRTMFEFYNTGSTWLPEKFLTGIS